MTIMGSPLISVCMIVRDEAAVLPRCLRAAVGLWDELVVVDTGSQDETVEIAQAYGADVLHYAWIAPGHKGAARNLGLEAATGEWCVVLDADEIVRGAPWAPQTFASSSRRFPPMPRRAMSALKTMGREEKSSYRGSNPDSSGAASIATCTASMRFLSTTVTAKKPFIRFPW